MLAQNLRQMLWLVICNLPLALYLGSSYAPADSSVWFVPVTFYSAAVGHFFILLLITSFLLILPFWLLNTKRPTVRFLYAVVITTLFHTMLAADSQLFALSRFHFNREFLEFLSNSDGATFFTVDTWISIALRIVAIVCYVLAATAAAMFLGFKGVKSRLLVILALVLYVVANLIHAYSAVKQIQPVTEIKSRLPLYAPLTMNSFLMRHGFIESDDLTLRGMEILRTDSFAYPKKPLSYLDNAREPYNVLLLTIGSLRHDMVTDEVMPHTAAFARDSWTFTNFFAGSNTTRDSIFSLLYGVPASYWPNALNTGTPSVIAQAVRDRGYLYGIFSSGALLPPEFTTTVFARTPDVQGGSDSSGVLSRDRNCISSFADFLKRLEPKERFFSFVFLDSLYSSQYPEDMKLPFIPSVPSIDFTSLGRNADPTPVFNHYRNAAFYMDQQIAQVLEILNQSGRADDTIVIITSDHGEEFNDNGDNYWGHGGNFTDAQIKVPLIMSWPNKGSRVESKTACAYDLSATLLPYVFGVKNRTSDYSIGTDLFDLKDFRNVVVSSHIGNAVIEPERIVMIDSTGGLSFKDRQFRASDRMDRSASIFEAIRAMTFYLQDSEADVAAAEIAVESSIIKAQENQSGSRASALSTPGAQGAANAPDMPDASGAQDTPGTL